MAWYIDSEHVIKNERKEVNSRYEKIWKPGENPDWAGIYRCQACGYEDLINRQCTKLPPCSNCDEKGHANNTWKLLVRAVDAK
ncbi:hypothetical protein [Enterobacter sp. TCD1-1]|jgi:transcription initiation factor IIE alpha subunit|uniref:hypothetical protein n=1 Tax=Enterobacter sp. TCD1-1 TaxID=1955625 RepID=UPI001E5E834B|nr:hypothetical protein [Enterobacter sp. TCD1-1]MCB5949339.1 hypothetical protein [Enterobacter sp. TCD1-1]